MRIATSFIAQRASADFQKAQIELFEAQRQAGSERKANDLKGYEREASQLISARGLLDRAESYAAAGDELLTRIDIQDVALGRAATAASDLKTFLTNAVGLGEGDEIMNQVELAFFNVSSAMETTHAGRYVFGGVRDNASPLNISTLADLNAAPTVGDIFENAPRPPRVQIDPRTSMEVAPLADDVSSEIFGILKDMYAFNDSPPPPATPFAGPLTAEQKTAVEGWIQRLEGAVKNLNQQQSLNGGVYQRAEGLISRQTEESEYFNTLVGNIQNADLAEVASRLSQAQLQLEASARVFSVLTQSSVLNYI